VFGSDTILNVVDSAGQGVPVRLHVQLRRDRCVLLERTVGFAGRRDSVYFDFYLRFVFFREKQVLRDGLLEKVVRPFKLFFNSDLRLVSAVFAYCYVGRGKLQHRNRSC